MTVTDKTGGKSGIFLDDYATFHYGRGRGELFLADQLAMLRGPSAAERMYMPAGPYENKKVILLKHYFLLTMF